MYEDAVDIKFEKEILNINDSINNVEKEREIYKEEYEQKKSNLIQAIHDGIQQTI